MLEIGGRQELGEFGTAPLANLLPVEPADLLDVDVVAARRAVAHDGKLCGLKLPNARLPDSRWLPGSSRWWAPRRRSGRRRPEAPSPCRSSWPARCPPCTTG